MIQVAPKRSKRNNAATSQGKSPDEEIAEAYEMLEAAIFGDRSHALADGSQRDAPSRKRKMIGTEIAATQKKMRRQARAPQAQAPGQPRGGLIGACFITLQEKGNPIKTFLERI